MASSMGRAAQHGIISNQSSRAASIGKKDYLKAVVDDFDDDDLAGGSYSIDPSVQMWKTIAIPRSRSKTDVANSLDSSSNNSSFSSSLTQPKKASFRNHDDPSKPHIMQSFSTTSIPTIKKKESELISTSNELDDLHRALDELQFDKRDADRRKTAEKSVSNDSELNQSDINNLTNELLKQKQEFQEMMMAIQREKQELALRTKALEAEKKQQELREEQMKARAAEEMRVQLEIMKMQNQMMMNRMEKSQQEHAAMLEQERKEREIAVAKMEAENQKLTQKIIEAQAKAEQDLAKEREDMRNTLRKMETEKFELLERIRATEEKSKEEAMVLEAQRVKFQESLEKMESEKQQLDARINENEIKSRLATEEVASQLKSEREKLLEKITAMEKEKEKLADSLAATESRARSAAEDLERQLAQERQELQDRIERMEKEKKDLAMHFAITEKISQQETQTIVDSLMKEKSDVASAIDKNETEKLNIENKLAANLANLAISPNGEEFIAERESLQAKYDSNNNERLLLAEKLRLAEEALVVRDRLLAEKALKEKDELKQAVMRMKEEVHTERQSEERHSTALRSLKSSKSLLEAVAEPSHNADQINKTINTIKEVDEDRDDTPISGDKSFMDALSDEDKEADPSELFPDLPAPHAAAACGNFTKLLELYNIEPSLLSSYDDARRSPLFYSVAYGKDKITKFLLDRVPEAALVPDEHGDFPLHAATSAGSSNCVEMLIKVTDGLVSVKNKMDMTPAHLACNVDCLDILYKYGADISALDCNGRSPLFVACAMNRDDIVEYLINALDQDGTSLLTKDNRGDTPLHAAACNGSVDCLLLLLQYGIDPTVLNDSGLKAIDLAIKNKQKKCRELLAEYSLHFFTSSDFDSVLFWATLEGHKLVKQKAEDISNMANYDIIKKHPSMAHLANPNSSFSLQGGKTGGLNRNQSLFSMKNQSLRLQKWGNWIAYNDATTSKMYWYNSETAMGQWETPAEVISLQQAAIEGPSKGSGGRLNSNKTLTAKLSMRLKRVGEWIEYNTESGVPFYYHEKTGEFQWSPPDVGGKAVKGTTNNNTNNNNNNTKGIDNFNDNSGNTNSAPSPSPLLPAAKEEKKALSAHFDNPFEDSSPSISSQQDAGNKEESAASSKNSVNFGDWRPFICHETGNMYWYNQATKESQWETPYDVQSAIDSKTGSTPGSAIRTHGGDGDDHEASQVTDLNDLF